MAIDLRAVSSFPYFHTIASLSETNALEIKLPPEAGKISIGCELDKIFVYQNGLTDGAVVSGSENHAFIPAANFLPIGLGKGSTRAQSIFLASAESTAAVKVSIILEEKT